MLAFLLGLFRLVWLFGKDNRGVVLENLALRPANFHLQAQATPLRGP